MTVIKESNMKINKAFKRELYDNLKRLIKKAQSSEDDYHAAICANQLDSVLKHVKEKLRRPDPAKEIKFGSMFLPTEKEMFDIEKGFSEIKRLERIWQILEDEALIKEYSEKISELLEVRHCDYKDELMEWASEIFGITRENLDERVSKLKEVSNIDDTDAVMKLAFEVFGLTEKEFTENICLLGEEYDDYKDEFMELRSEVFGLTRKEMKEPSYDNIVEQNEPLNQIIHNYVRIMHYQRAGYNIFFKRSADLKFYRVEIPKLVESNNAQERIEKETSVIDNIISNDLIEEVYKN